MSVSPEVRSLDAFGELNLRACLEIAKRRKMWIILATISLSVSMAVFAYCLPDIYRAETVILVDSANFNDN